MQTESASNHKSRSSTRILEASVQSILDTFGQPDVRPICPKRLSGDEAGECFNTPRPGDIDSMNIEAPVSDIGNTTYKYFVEVSPTILPDVGMLEIPALETMVEPAKPKQHWSAYNAAQMNEIRIFDDLLAELVGTIEEPVQEGRGRRRLSLSTQIFSAVLKVYSQVSSRRSQSILDRAQDEGDLKHAPHYNAISKTLLDKSMTPILQRLIRLSAQPLADIEMDFAVDSSGFRCSNFGAYRGEKYDLKREHNWIKAHICTGVKTNIVTDVKVTDGKANDCPHLAGLVQNTAKTFDISEVSADKGYTSRDNLQLIADLGATPFIPFKSNATEKGMGRKMWRKMYHYFQLNRDDFMAHYHKRSNVESTFGAIKMKFGETLKSKDPTAQTNELLCKILAYNITVLIHEMYESGITPDFLIPETPSA